MLSDWQELFEKIVVYRGNLTLATNEEIIAFEERTGIILPEGYKEYCQVFGAGEIGNGVIEIHNPYHYMPTYGELWLTRLTED
ncbi:MAG: SMI1/KNR4 family protein [Rivularia sp. (in: Bacteria)]|nr:SMI1/KNR4 family protein [Rivularia sp. MS3]